MNLSRLSVLLGILLYSSRAVSQLTITSTPNRTSPAVFQAGENITLTCSGTGTFSWTTSLTDSNGNGLTNSNSATINGVFLHGANSGTQSCTSGGSTATYMLTVEGTSIWYNNPTPGHILLNNTAISVFTHVYEVRCYTGDTSGTNTNSSIINPSGNSPLTFTNAGAGFLKKSGETSITSTTNGVYSCRYVNGSGVVSWTSFAVYSRDREPGSANTTSLEVQSVEYSLTNNSITVSCTSSGWPATQVIWTKDGTTLTAGGDYAMRQTVLDRTQSIYKNELIVVNSISKLGAYRCKVQTIRHNDVLIDSAYGSVTVQAAGAIMVAVTTTGSLDVGDMFTLNCTVRKVGANDSLVIVWLKDNVTLTSSNASAGIMFGSREEDSDYVSRALTLSPIRLSHDGQYSCEARNNTEVGRATIRVEIEVPYLALSLDPSPEMLVTLGDQLSLTCTASVPESISGSISSIIWYQNSVQITNGVTTSLSEGTSTLNLDNVLSDGAGNYTCYAAITSPYIDTGIVLNVTNTTIVTVMMPTPNNIIFALSVLAQPYYAGVSRDLDCTVVINHFDDSHVNIDTNIMLNGSTVTDIGSRRRLRSQQESGNTFRRRVIFRYFVASQDTGNYTCNVRVTSDVASGYVVNTTGNVTNEYVFVAPKPTVQLVSNAYRVPSHSSYNQITLNCTGSLALASDDILEFAKVFAWSRDGSSVSGASAPTDPYLAVSYSSLNQSLASAGTVMFSCAVSISVTGDPTVSTTDNVSIIVTGPSLPVSPINTTATNILYNGAVIKWIVPSISYTPEQYTVEYGLANNTLTETSTVLTGTTNYNSIDQELSIELTDLVHETDYYYLVKATNTEGSTNSTVRNFRTREKPPTAPPDNFTISVLSSSSLSLYWDPPPANHRNGLIIRFNLTCYETINGNALLVTTPTFPRSLNGSEPISIDLNGFRPGTFINCSVTSSNEVGTGPPAYSSATTVEEAPAGPPLSFNIISEFSRQLIISWSPPDPFLQHGLITNYTLTCLELDRMLIPQSFPRTYPHPPPVNVTVGGLRPFTSYNCSLIASNGAGHSRAATERTMTEPDVPDSAPRMFSVTPVDSTSLRLSWRPVLEIEQNGIIINYTVACNTTTPTYVGVDDVTEMSDGQYSWVIDDLVPGTVYRCEVFANTTEGRGPESSGVVRTLEEAPGTPPLNVALTADSTHTVYITWSAPSAPNGHITQYTLYLNFSNSTQRTVNVITGNQYAVTGLRPYWLVEVRVSAWTAVGEGPMSALRSIRTHEDIPGQVEGIRYITMSADVLLVNFTEQPLSVANGIITGYVVSIVKYIGTDRQVQNVPASNRVMVRFTMLNDSTPYNVTVTANNSAGLGQPTTAIVFTIQGVPPKPMNVSVERINSTAMTVSWRLIPITEAKGFITSYTVSYMPSSRSITTRQSSSGSVMVPSNRSSVDIGGLNPNVRYSVRVTAATSVGDGEISDPETLDLPVASTSAPFSITYIGAVVGIVVALLIFIIFIIIVIVIVRQRSLSKTVIAACNNSYELPLHNMSEEKVELKDMSSLNGEIEPHTESPSVPIVVPEIMSMDEKLKPIPKSAFSQHVKEMHRERDKGFELEYQSLTTPAVKAHEAAKLDCNRPKNRFANIYPFDFSRVELSSVEGQEGSDYINASLMDGYNRPNAYIAAQGPLQNTVNDFWRMIWEHRLDTVVMLTKCIEAGKRKCEQYWPDKINEVLETSIGIDVTLTSITPFADFELKKFRVEKVTESDAPPLEVSHWHFLGWPDHGCPQYATSLISFIRQVRKTRNKFEGPAILVHCSAGVGRTGAFILLDSMLERLFVEDTINVYEFLKQMRTKRVFMVQTLAQYVFIHDAIDELITCGETDIPINNLKQKIANLHQQIQGKKCTGFESQFQLLEQVCRKPSDVDCSDALQSYNRPKNRYLDRVPYNITRTRLRPTGAQGSEYINASFIDGYKLRNAYIATQSPLQNTVHDFWRMIWEFKSKAIILLSQLEENGVEVCYPFWPQRQGEPLQFNKLIVTLQTEIEKLGGYVMRKLEIKEDRPQPVSFVVTLFHFTDWEEHCCPSTTPGILTMLEELNKVQRNTGNKPITVMCNDGQSRTGSFVCIHAQQDRLKTEAVVDVFHFIKSIRIQRPRMVADLEQFIFCHQVLQEYFEKFNVYSNFK